MKELIYGKNVVKEAIQAKRNIKKLYILSKQIELIEIANKNHLDYEILNQKQMDSLVKGMHQGIIAQVEEYKYVELSDLLQNVHKKYPLIVMLDSLEDPHNLGAILRTCDAAGVDGVIIGKNRSVHLNATVAKVSTGAIEYVKVCEVVNLVNTIKKLKENGYWIIGAEKTPKSTNYDQMKYNMPICLVIGSEGKGISRLVLENCDFLVQIPMVGHVNSLNASVSCSILVYEIIKYRKQ